MKVLSLILITTCFSACSLVQSSDDSKPIRYKATLAKIDKSIVKHGKIHPNGETTPFVWNNQLHYFINSPAAIDIRDADMNQISHTSAPMQYGSAFVHNGRIYAFGTTPLNYGQISMMSSADLINWTAPVVVLTGGGLYNTSVALSPNGEFIMAVEYASLDDDNFFKTKFYKSNDLTNWTYTGFKMFPRHLTSAPTLRYVSPHWYVVYTSESFPGINKSWNLNIARSTDLSSWQDSDTQVIAASDELDGNASDLDFVEFNGVLEMTYLTTPQDGRPIAHPDTGLVRATYNGTLKQYLEQFFN